MGQTDRRRGGLGAGLDLGASQRGAERRVRDPEVRQQGAEAPEPRGKLPSLSPPLLLTPVLLVRVPHLQGRGLCLRPPSLWVSISLSFPRPVLKVSLIYVSVCVFLSPSVCLSPNFFPSRWVSPSLILDLS